MKKKDFLIQRKKVIQFYKKWKPLLKLDNWSIRFDFREEKEDTGIEYQKGEFRTINGAYELVMKTTCDPYYLQTVIDVYCPVLVNYTDDEIEESLIHELMHVMVSPLSPNKKTMVEESVVTLLARSLMNVDRCRKKI